jgi:hypothetical protein
MAVKMTNCKLRDFLRAMEDCAYMDLTSYFHLEDEP